MANPGVADFYIAGLQDQPEALLSACQRILHICKNTLWSPYKKYKYSEIFIFSSLLLSLRLNSEKLRKFQ